MAVAPEPARARLAADAAPRAPALRWYRGPRPPAAARRLVFDWAIDVAQVRRMAADARLWNRVVEAQSPLHYFGGFCWQLLFNLERGGGEAPPPAAADGPLLGDGGGGAGGAGGGGGGEAVGADAAGAEAVGGDGAVGGGGDARAAAAAGGVGDGAAAGGAAAGAPGAAAAAAAAAGVVEFVGLRCCVALGARDVWPRVVHFRANIHALSAGFWDEYGYGKGLEGVIQDGVGLGWPGFFGLGPGGDLATEAAWARFARGGRIYLRAEVLECS